MTLHPSEILKLARASAGEPVEIKLVDGRIYRALIKMDIKEMSEEGFKEFWAQLSGQRKHGTLTVYESNKTGMMIVQWEESVLIGQRR